MKKPMPAKPAKAAKAARKAAPAKKNAKAKASNQVAVPTSARPAEEKKWRAEDALRTLTRAAEIQRDPKLMKDARALAQQQMAQLRQVSGGMAGGEDGGKKA